MKYLYLTSILFTFLIFPLFGQISFEKGYIIDNTGNKTSCLIKNKQWKNNPIEFEYRLTKNSQILTGSIEDISEFSINDNITKYTRFTVQIDRASNLAEELSRVKNAEFETETLFLKTLVEGDATLFSYHDKSISRYFYTVGGANVEQLIYKQYTLDKKNINENARFRQQIFTTLKCGDDLELENLQYKKHQLSKIFIKYNKCMNTKYAVYSKDANLDFNLVIKPGLNFKSLNIYSSHRENILFGQETNLRIGLSGEAILGFNNNKWSIIIEPSYQYFNSTTDLYMDHIVNPTTVLAEVNYQTLEIPFGIRHYFFLSKNSKLFVNSFVTYNIPLEVEIKYSVFNINDYFHRILVGDVGVGYNFKKFSGEIRYASKRDIFIGRNYWEGKYGGFSMILGYELF